MNLRHFVSASAVVLVGWLAVTFVYHMPSQRYPRQDKLPKATAAGESATPEASREAGVFPVSVSR